MIRGRVGKLDHIPIVGSAKKLVWRWFAEGTVDEDLAVLSRFHGRGANETCDDRPLRCDDAERSIAACLSEMAERMAGSERVHVARTSNLVEIEMEGQSGVVPPPAVTFHQSLLFDP